MNSQELSLLPDRETLIKEVALQNFENTPTDQFGGSLAEFVRSETIDDPWKTVTAISIAAVTGEFSGILGNIFLGIPADLVIQTGVFVTFCCLAVGFAYTILRAKTARKKLYERELKWAREFFSNDANYYQRVSADSTKLISRPADRIKWELSSQLRKIEEVIENSQHRCPKNGVCELCPEIEVAKRYRESLRLLVEKYNTRRKDLLAKAQKLILLQKAEEAKQSAKLLSERHEELTWQDEALKELTEK